MKEKKKHLSTRESIALLLRRAAGHVEDRSKPMRDSLRLIAVVYAVMTRAKRSR